MQITESVNLDVNVIFPLLTEWFQAGFFNLYEPVSSSIKWGDKIV